MSTFPYSEFGEHDTDLTRLRYAAELVLHDMIDLRDARERGKFVDTSFLQATLMIEGTEQLKELMRMISNVVELDEGLLDEATEA